MKKKRRLTIFGISITVIAAGIAAVIGYRCLGTDPKKLSQKEMETLSISREEITIPGLTKEYHLFFLADSHISLCDDRDPEVQEKADARQAAFVNGEGISSWETFDRLVCASNTLGSDLFIMGGDIIDSAMYASIDYLKTELDKLDAPYLYSLGNHDFEYGEEYFSAIAYEEYLPRLGEVTTEETYQIREYEDLIIFSANDKNNQIDQSTVDGLKLAMEKDKPVILVLHVPLEPLTQDTALLDETIRVWGASKAGRSKVIIGKDGCRPKQATQEFIKLVTAENSPVKLVLGGHIHFYHKDQLTDTLTQIVTGAAYEKNALYVTLKPE